MDKGRKAIIDYRMIWRWHFYAGLVCLPFIIILSITGPIYLFKPQIEAAIDARYDNLPFAGAAQPLSAQVRAAEAAVPGAVFKAVEIRPNDHDAARVTLQKGSEKLGLYVHPQNLSILKHVAEKDRFMEVVKTIHGELVSGRFGEVIVELAASWAIVMILTGLYLWWPRQAKGLAGVLWPRFGLGKRVFWRDIHAVTGIWVSGFALVLLISGLPWTFVWGSAFKEVRKLGQPAISQDWTQGRTSERGAAKAEGMKAVDLTYVDGMADMARGLDLPPPVILSAPAKGNLWKLSAEPGSPTERVSLMVEPQMLEVISRESFEDKKVVDQVVGIGIAAHEGRLFGWLNQLLGLLTAIGLLTLCVSAVVMWWQRRPNDALGAPALLPDERLGPGLSTLILVLAICLPVLGISLVAIAIIERLILRRISAARAWLGLTA
ncbi:peptidase [Asticcacaulis sp. AC460]|uniref:PepSY-associated TM helix domain-containing protein n=1 Tax=Asticcacaulis sp. AC460 TaxID=1282360 RepID=UPI0003C40D9F|nr:PepSY domain-containing protein [Asticcacaulis sp. AC460]ESQ89626.1 peptidase [Asticcacaulis sp. AC460]